MGRLADPDDERGKHGDNEKGAGTPSSRPPTPGTVPRPRASTSAGHPRIGTQRKTDERGRSSRQCTFRRPVNPAGGDVKDNLLLRGLVLGDQRRLIRPDHLLHLHLTVSMRLAVNMPSGSPDSNRIAQPQPPTGVGLGGRVQLRSSSSPTEASHRQHARRQAGAAAPRHRGRYIANTNPRLANEFGGDSAVEANSVRAATTHGHSALLSAEVAAKRMGAPTPDVCLLPPRGSCITGQETNMAAPRRAATISAERDTPSATVSASVNVALSLSTVAARIRRPMTTFLSPLLTKAPISSAAASASEPTGART